MTHIVWDWNGTLFNDAHLVVTATNAAFAAMGIKRPTSLDDYRRMFVRPIPLFYERLLGRPLVDGEWEQIDAGFHEEYAARIGEADLATDARALLAEWQAVGGTQSLLSMWRHAELVPLVERLEIDSAFVRVDGLREPSDGGGKLRYIVAHLAALDLDPSDVTLIGDSVDDAHAAAAVGARAVLYAGGLHGAADLAATGAPVVDSLPDAVRHVHGSCGGSRVFGKNP